MRTSVSKNNLKTIFLLSGATIVFASVPEVSAQAVGDEIIVTAQKREQNVQDVPIAIQVIGDKFIDDLAADNISDVSQFIPGLEVGATSPTQPRYKIRGINTSDFGIGTDPAVGVYVDGVYSARSGAAVLSFGDIERIEVLKGPQGTLFGRNSAAGAVSIVTKKPTQELEGHITGRLGNYGKRRVEATVNVPLTDNIAVRVNGLYNKRDGLFEDAATGQELGTEDNWATRAALRWEPTDATDVAFTWTHDNLDQDARPAIGIVLIPAAPGLPPIPVNPATYLDPLTAPIMNDVVGNSESRNLDEMSLVINHDFGNIAFTSITSWREFQTQNREDEDGTNRIDLYFDTNNIENNESWYQEFRLAGETGPVNWIAGASYFSEKANQASDTFTYTDTVNTTLGNIGFGTPFADLENDLLIPFNVPATLFGVGWREAMFNEGNFTAFAVYADAIWAVNDQMNVTVGGRYTRDDKEFQWLNGLREAPELDATLAALDGMGLLALAGTSPAAFQFDFVFDQSGLAGVPCDNGVTVTEGVPCVLDRDWSDFSPRVVVDYRMNDNVLAYASFAKGYKAGGFNSVEIASEFDNEDVTNFELGFKGSFPDNNLTLNLSGFRYVYKDKQSIRLGTVAGSAIPQYLVETSDDQAWGIDLQTNWTPSEPLTIFANAQYIDATFKKRTLSNGTDISGEPTGEPSLQAAFGARYSHALSSGGRLKFQVAHSYQSKTRENSGSISQGTTSNTTAFEVDAAQNRTDLRASWVSPDERFELGVYANNVFDNQYVRGVNNLTAATLGTAFASITDPIFWGSDLRINF